MRVVGILGLLFAVFVGAGLTTSANERGGDQAVLSVLVEALLSSPDQYSERAVVIRGVVAATARAVFPNGRLYYTLSVADGGSPITVFSWDRPPVERGRCVEVSGIFHIWRYNLHPVIESQRITVLPSSADPSAPAASGCRPTP